MTGIPQISGAVTAGTSTKGADQPVVFTAAQGVQGFGLLLEMLASLTANNGTQQPLAGILAESQTTNQGESSGQSASGTGGSSSGNAYLLSIEQQLAELLSGGKVLTKQGKSSDSASQETTAYIIPGIPFVVGYQDQSATTGQGQSVTSGDGQATSAGGASTILAQIERDVSAILESGQSAGLYAGQATSTYPTSATPAQIEQDLSAIFESGQSQSSTGDNPSTVGNTTQQPNSSDGRVPVEAGTQVLKAAANPAFKTDLMKLLAAASGSTSDPKVAKELNALLANLKNGNGSSVQEVAQKLGSSVADPAKQSVPSGQTNSPALQTGSTSQQPAQQLQELGGAVVSEVKGNVQNQPSAVTQNSTTAAASPSVGRTGTTSVVAAAPVPDPANQQGSGTSGAGNQPATQQGTNAAGQIPQVRASLSGQDGQGTSGSGNSGKDFASMIKTAATQSFVNASDGSKGAVTFQQTLSSMQQNSAHSVQLPDINRLAQGIVREVKMMSQEGKTVVNMKLEPDSLGSVTLQVSSEGGKISAQFNVKTADARAYLESSVPQMRQMLETNGVTLSHLTVGLSGGDLPSSNPQYTYQRKRQGARYYSNRLASATAVAHNTPEISRTFGYNTMEIRL